ncbi:MAG: DNA replication/repair protein RecF [Candidatus Chaera renei]|uniref:DNA replication and repair protein RecF n=1 Tax=Candidatus Chaera renei TaxID=2506947 RepID=A0A4Q0AJJ0_9BACT|nr:MAG: DNA replication/repair protein RecF [Candidatus Chaera renei]
MISEIKLQSFRCYLRRRFVLSPGVSVFYGPNGSGKTSVLEALMVVCRGGSFRGSDQDLLKTNHQWWRLESLAGDSQRTVVYDSRLAAGKKHYVINGQKKQRLPASLRLPVVLFEPGDLRLLGGSPARRRRFLDNLISQIEPAYAPLIARYERSLKQRNNLLKSDRLNPDELFVWDITLSNLAAQITAKRQEYAAAVNRQLLAVHGQVSGRKDKVGLTYRSLAGDGSRPPDNLAQYALGQLGKSRQKDLALGYTSSGPHRDDLNFYINRRDAASSASRGETRSLVLALKFIELNIIEQLTGHQPLLLLDDVLSELDESRRHALLSSRPHGQTIITTTDVDNAQIKYKDAVFIGL